MGMTNSLAQRLAERARARADAHHERSMADGVFDDDEEETERDMRATAREMEQYADIQDAAHSLAWNGLTERNVRRMHDFAGLKQIA